MERYGITYYNHNIIIIPMIIVAKVGKDDMVIGITRKYYKI